MNIWLIYPYELLTSDRVDLVGRSRQLAS